MLLMDRLQKVIANCGIASRRKAEQLITEGRVKVNGVICDKLGTTVSKTDVVEVDGKIIANQSKVYLVMNKPRNYICAVSDDRGRPVITELITDIEERIYPVGRLDFDTTGVIILTNDGEFANTLMHPSNHIKKTYRVSISGRVENAKIQKLREGVELDGVLTQNAIIEIVKFNAENNKTTVNMSIFEGKNHQVKRMFEAIGYQVVKLHRVSVGEISDKGMKFGQYRDLSEQEISSFYK